MIELKDVSLGYNRRAILKNITLTAMPGQVSGLIGPNGSGKSTLIKGISRVITIFSGYILIEGKDIRSMKREELARLVAVVPQNPVLPEVFTVFEVVLMGRTPYLGLFRSEGKEDMAIASQAMEATQIEGLAQRRVGELSGGERQRVVIARALTQQPKALLLDEPTTHLDIHHQIEILDLVKNLCREQGLDVIVALHDLNLAAQYCDHLIMLNRGRIHSEGRPQDVLTTKSIKDVYGAEVFVFPHPINKLPTTLIVAAGNHSLKEVVTLPQQ